MAVMIGKRRLEAAPPHPNPAPPHLQAARSNFEET